MGEKLQAFRWIELGAMRPGGGMHRNHFERADNPAALEAWRQEHDNTDVFASVGCYAEPGRASPALSELFFDFDNKDLETARTDTLRAIDLLFERVGIAPEALEIRFSSQKGFHILVPWEVFGEPIPGLMEVWRGLADRLHRAGIPSIDLGVYQDSRLLRLVNSRNSRSGLFDVPVAIQELRDLGMQFVREVARAPREWASMAVPMDCPRAAQWLYKARQWAQQRRRGRQVRRATGQAGGWRFPPCVRAAEQATLPDGVRHASYLVLARFYAGTGMAQEEAMDRLLDLDQRHPIRDPDYIERVTRNLGKLRPPRACPQGHLKTFCQPDHCPLADTRPAAGPDA